VEDREHLRSPSGIPAVGGATLRVRQRRIEHGVGPHVQREGDHGCIADIDEDVGRAVAELHDVPQQPQDRAAIEPRR
jgi:hypothetical protein